MRRYLFIAWLLATLALLGGGRSPAVAQVQDRERVVFAVIGDFGVTTPDAQAVADLVRSWQPDFVATTGDNNYPSGAATTIDEHIGRYYGDFIAPYQGRFGPGATVNRFFPVLGNHDWDTADAAPYRGYFALPGNERYYETSVGPLRLFALDSDPREPDGVTSDSRQAAWLRERLSQSTACWNLVFVHHPPFSSGLHGSNLWTQWPYRAWGADAVLSGHDHSYERIVRDGFPFFVNGLGGAPRYPFAAPVTGSAVRFADAHGALRVTASRHDITYEFITVDGALVDTFTQRGGCETATVTPAPTPGMMPTPLALVATVTPTATLLPTSVVIGIERLRPDTLAPVVAARHSVLDTNRDGRLTLDDLRFFVQGWLIRR